MSKLVTVKNARLSYPHLFQPADYQGNGQFAYSAKLLVPKGSPADKEIQAAIDAAAQEVWPKTWQKELTILRAQGPMKNCYVDGDTTGRDDTVGMMVLSAKRPINKGQPNVIDADTSPLQESSGRPYAGCYVFASVDIYCQSGPKAGIRCGLRWVQFAKDGEPFTGGAAQVSADEFQPINPEEFADLI